MTTVPLSEAKTHLARLLAEVEKLGTRRDHHQVGPARRRAPVDRGRPTGCSRRSISSPTPSSWRRFARGLRDAEQGRVLGDDEVWR